MEKILITRPRHDDTINYLYFWSKEIIEEADQRGFDILNLEGERAVKKNLESMINSQDPQFIIFNGHGTNNSILGHKNTELIKLGENDELLEHRIVYSISCNSAKVLGAECKAKSFIGFSEPFVFIVDANSTARPLEDRFAKPFLQSANKFSMSMLKGHDVKEAFDASQKKFSDWVEYYSNTESPEASSILPWLEWDRQFQTAHGDLLARV